MAWAIAAAGDPERADRLLGALLAVEPWQVPLSVLVQHWPQVVLLVARRRGDQLVVTKLDRLGRSLEHLIDLSAQLQERGVDLAVLDQKIDTSTAMGRMFFQILGSIAEFEHALMSERTLDGLAAARTRGRTGGQKPKLTTRQAKIAREMYEETGPDGRRVHTVEQIAAEFGVTRPTIYRHLAKLPAQTPTP